MPKRKNNHIVFLTIVCCFLFAIACTNRPKDVLSHDKMVNVLTDLHKLDGILSAEGMLAEENPLYCEYVLEKHRINQAVFDSSLVWYAHNPKRFEKVYIKVVDNIKDWEKEILGGKYHPIEPDTILSNFAFLNIWNDSTSYLLTGDSARTELSFEIKNDSLLFGDLYILSFRQRIAPEDSTLNRQAQLYINYEDGKSDTLSTILHNDSLLRRFKFYKFVDDTLKIKSIAGKLLSGTDYKGTQNVFVDSISLKYRYIPEKQDSLRKIINIKNDTTIAALPLLKEEPVNIPEKQDSLRKKINIKNDTTTALPLLKEPVNTLNREERLRTINRQKLLLKKDSIIEIEPSQLKSQ